MKNEELKKIILIDYISAINENEKPMGHAMKILKEYGGYVCDEYQITYAVSEKYAKYLLPYECKYLQWYVKKSVKRQNSISKLSQMLGSFKNIYCSLCQTEGDIYWFCNVDLFIYLFLGIFGTFGKKIIITTYTSKLDKRYHNYFMKKVLGKVYLVTYSNPNLFYKGHNTFYMPDYLYDKRQYQKFEENLKKCKVVCVGTITRKKNIRQLVELFNLIKRPLEIYGEFEDYNYYKEIITIANKNIKIENRLLDDNEYLYILSSAKFSILPYDGQGYANITSGILLESLFVNTIPITTKLMLEKIGVLGVAYEELEKLSDTNWFLRDYTEEVRENRKIIEQNLSKTKILPMFLSKLKVIT